MLFNLAASRTARSNIYSSRTMSDGRRGSRTTHPPPWTIWYPASVSSFLAPGPIYVGILGRVDCSFAIPLAPRIAWGMSMLAQGIPKCLAIVSEPSKASSPMNSTLNRRISLLNRFSKCFFSEANGSSSICASCTRWPTQFPIIRTFTSHLFPCAGCGPSVSSPGLPCALSTYPRAAACNSGAHPQSPPHRSKSGIVPSAAMCWP